MGTKQQSRKRKKSEKRKKQRAEARSTRGSRAAPGGSARVNMDKALRWPTGECYLSESWYDQGARVAAIFTRRSRSGRVVVGVFDVDLAERGVLEAGLRGGLSDVDVHAELARLSGEGTAMVAREPALVAKLVTEAWAFADERRVQQAHNYAKVARIFAGVDPADASETILVGTEPPPPEKRSIGQRLKSLVGRR